MKKKSFIIIHDYGKVIFTQILQMMCFGKLLNLFILIFELLF